MKNLSDESRALLDSLLQPATGLGRVLRHPALWNVEAIARLGNSREPAAIPYLVPALFSEDREARITAARAVRSLLALIDVADLTWLDESMRKSWYGDTWQQVKPRQLARLVGPSEPDAIVLEISSMHPNGFVREEAARRLSLRGDGDELPYLLLRLNDWVPQVRGVALDAVRKRITTDYTKHFVRNLTLIARLEQKRRGEHQEVLQDLTTLLASPGARPLMLQAMSSTSRAVRRTSFRVLTASPLATRDAILTAIAVHDPVIRLWAVRAAQEALERQELKSALNALSVDWSAPVRREALHLWATLFPEEAADVLKGALLDRSASIRALARFHLGNNVGDSFRSFYRMAIDKEASSRLSSAITGLAETGIPDDAATLERFVQHPSPAIRRTSIRCLLRLGGDRYVEHILCCLNDVSPSVSKEARRVLLPYASTIGGPRLWRLFTESKLRHARENTIALISGLPKWDALNYLLYATVNVDDQTPLSDIARNYVVRWNSRYNRSQVAPSATQLASIRSALAVAVGTLPSETAASIVFAVRSYEGSSTY